MAGPTTHPDWLHAWNCTEAHILVACSEISHKIEYFQRKSPLQNENSFALAKLKHQACGWQ